MTETEHSTPGDPGRNDPIPTDERLRALADKLIGKLSGAVDDITESELITDRQALRNITGALKDLRDLCGERESRAAPAAESAPTLTVAFLGDAEKMAE